MDNSTYWICVDEKGYESVFTYEPHYNYLYGTWRNSFGGTYITKGMIKLLVEINFDTSNLKAYAIEVSKISLTNNKLSVQSVTKIYKDN